MSSLLDGVPLLDHHCHGVVGTSLSRHDFESMLCEADAPGRWHGTLFDTSVGFAVRRLCAPLLDLPAWSEPDDYLARRDELGADEVNRRLLGSTGTTEFLVDTGYVPAELTSPDELAALAGGSAREIVRLEKVAEQVVGSTDAAGFADAFRTTLAERATDAAGFKSIAAYRVGLDLDPERPSEDDVRDAVGAWMREIDETGSVRAADEVLSRFVFWCAVDLGKPVQFHVGYGDAEVDMVRCDPLHLMPLLRATAGLGVPVTLLHNYPFHRNAGYLAQVFDHVFVDVGLITHNVGDRSAEVLAELLELAPFGSALFSSDAFGLSELYAVSTELFRRAFTTWLDNGIASESLSAAEAERLVTMVCRDNARRAYSLDGSS